VLDVSCGEGYGSALLAGVATSVLGVDIAAEAIAHAHDAYAERANLRFAQGSAAALPLADASVDVAVSFETIEHLPAADQPRMLAELARVLRPDGLLVLSAPNPVEYSQARNHRNPFHLHELSRDEPDAMLAGSFRRAVVSAAPLLRLGAVDEAPGRPASMPGRGCNRVAAARPDAVFSSSRRRDGGALPEGGRRCRCFPGCGRVRAACASTRARPTCCVSTRCSRTRRGA
jgi:SAM-dependent methyltransferase